MSQNTQLRGQLMLCVLYTFTTFTLEDNLWQNDSYSFPSGVEQGKDGWSSIQSSWTLAMPRSHTTKMKHFHSSVSTKDGLKKPVACEVNAPIPFCSTGESLQKDAVLYGLE